MKNLKNRPPQFSPPTYLPCKCLLTLLAFAVLSIPARALDFKDLKWKLDASVEKVNFYHAITECNGQTVVFLKFVNNNKQAVSISWKETVTTQMRIENRLFRGDQQLTLQPGETVENSCSGTSCKACILTPAKVSPTYLVKILDFSFQDISVTNNL